MSDFVFGRIVREGDSLPNEQRALSRATKPTEVSCTVSKHASPDLYPGLGTHSQSEVVHIVRDGPEIPRSASSRVRIAISWSLRCDRKFRILRRVVKLCPTLVQTCGVRTQYPVDVRRRRQRYMCNCCALLRQHFVSIGALIFAVLFEIQKSSPLVQLQANIGVAVASVAIHVPLSCKLLA